MRHRKGSISKKIKREHDILKDFEKILDQIAAWDEVDAILPGPISVTRGRVQDAVLRVQYQTTAGLKCLARKGKTVQEIYIVTSVPNEVRLLIENLSTK